MSNAGARVLRVEPAGGDSAVLGRRRRLAQALDILVDNAFITLLAARP